MMVMVGEFCGNNPSPLTPMIHRRRVCVYQSNLGHSDNKSSLSLGGSDDFNAVYLSHLTHPYF